MAGHGTGQERLDRIVQLIAVGMVAEVCSVYLLRPGDILELYATEGLRKDAVHRTRLRLGEGLVGNIGAHARPLALADAQSHPEFAFRPETGEEIYNALLGVPILRGGRVLGVLVVQNQTARDYAEEELETLETIAMVVAELISGGDLVHPDELGVAESVAGTPVRLDGVGLNGGLSLGAAVLHRRGATISQTVSEDPDRELERLAEALASMQGALDTMLETYSGGDGGEHLDILRTYRMFADDIGWVGRIREAIQSGLTAEAAVSKVLNDTRLRMQTAEDPYIRERLMDLDDLGYRLLQHLTGETGPAAAMNDDEAEFILVARSMGPAELLDYDRDRLRGLVLEEGSYNSHAAIVARALDIPVVGNVRYVLSKLEEGASVFVDGDSGIVVIRPGADFERRVVESVTAKARARAEEAVHRDLPAVTLDGEAISLMINAGLLIDLEHLEETGADGVGLLRTEISFMLQAAFPSVEEQRAVYERIYEAAGDKPVVLRTLDIGGDKLLPYFSGAEDENPAMGWRAMRIALDRPKMLCNQLRALIEAANGRDLKVMFPMVSEVAEFDSARRLLDRELDRVAAAGGTVPREISVGVMLEVPSLYFQLPALLGRIDFLSVGSNDLLQFLFASDRGNPRVGARYDALAPAALRLFKDVVRQCDDAGVPVGLCGEIAGRPLEAMALIGVGFRSLSMSPGAIGAIRMMTRRLDSRALTAYLDSIVLGPDHSLRGKLTAYARDHDIGI